MATTTNYSWSTPDDTALVKDGAAAIRSLGTAIDSTVFTNAGAAINKTIVDAKGDLIVASGADAVARLAVGTNDHVLTADSGATNGVKWAAIPASGGKTLISTTTLSGSSVSLTSIPGTYKDLYLVIRNFRPAQDNVGFICTLNNDTGTKYRDTGTFSTANFTANGTGMYLATTNLDNGVSDGLILLTIRDYANTTTRKLVEIVTLKNNNTTLANIDINLTNSIYFDNSAISQIDLFPEGVSGWTSGTALLYGVS